MSTNTTNQPFNWRVAAIGVALGVALGAGGTVLITVGGREWPRAICRLRASRAIAEEG